MSGLIINKPKLLIVERRDEEFFFGAAFRDHLNIGDVQILAIGGKTNLTRNLKALTKDANFPTVVSLGIVRDADLDATGAFDSIRSSLTSASLAYPGGHGQFTSTMPRIGVFIIANGTDNGMLETLCVNAVSGYIEYHCLTEYFKCLQGHNVIPNNLCKAQAHAWLASRVEPDKRVGEAAQKGYWPWNALEFSDLWSFLQTI